MPTTFSNQYTINNTGGGGYTVQGPGTAGSFEVTDDVGATDDEILVSGEDVMVNGTVVGQYVGSYNNEGVLYSSGGKLYLLTDDALGAGNNIPGSSINTGAELQVCFAAGTMIATPEGERAVETLGIGDPILTADGATIAVKWIGHQTLHRLFTPAERFAPVRIAAGALGGGLPVRDLVLTVDHALRLDGVMVQAGVLVDGETIAQVPLRDLPERVTYYHVETEGHEVILAEGAPAETLVDNVTRRAFDNFAEYAALYGEDETGIAEIALPRVMSRTQLPRRLRQRFGRRASAA